MSQEQQPTRSERIADRITSIVGSIPFVVIQSLFLLAWVTINSIAWLIHPDPYPFILMNLMLSLQAAYTGPFVLISENRQAASDRRTMERDAAINRKAEQEVKEARADQQAIKQLLVQEIKEVRAELQSIKRLLAKVVVE